MKATSRNAPCLGGYGGASSVATQRTVPVEAEATVGWHVLALSTDTMLTLPC